MQFRANAIPLSWAGLKVEPWPNGRRLIFGIAGRLK